MQARDAQQMYNPSTAMREIWKVASCLLRGGTAHAFWLQGVQVNRLIMRLCDMAGISLRSVCKSDPGNRCTCRTT